MKKLKIVAMLSCSMVLLAGGSCSFQGSFCEIARPMETDETTARYLLENDRALVIEMNVQNRLLDRCS
jgi:hypothetical protein